MPERKCFFFLLMSSLSLTLKIVTFECEIENQCKLIGDLFDFYHCFKWTQANANVQLEFKLKRANKIDRSVITSSGSGESLSLLSQDASKACSSLTDELPIDFQFRWKFRRRFQFSHERSQCYVRISRCHGRIIISDFEIDVIVFSLCIRGPDRFLLAMCIVHVLKSDLCC